jgi:UDP-glucose 4-epimerase
MRALVTGGAGFIGSHVVDALVERGDEVRVLDDLSSGRRENLEQAIGAGVELIEGSITDDAAVNSLFDAWGPDAVLHLAAQIDVRRSIAEPLFDLDLNVGGTIGLLEAARRQERCRFVFASTGGAIYGEGKDRELPLSEESDRLPDAHYGQSKYAAEGYIGLYRRLYGLEATALRLGNVYGPRQDPLGEAGVVAIFANALETGGRPKVFGDGLQTRDYVYVGDIAAAFMAALDGDRAGTYNIGTGAETSVLELGELIAAAFGVAFEPEMAPPRLGEVQRISIDPSRAESELGWRAEHDLKRGIGLTADWYRSL